MADMADLLRHFIDDPLGLLAVGVLGALKAVELLAKYVPQWLKLKLPTGKWQEFVSREIGDIKTNIEKLFAIVSTHEYLLDKTSEGTLVNQLFAEELSLFLRLKAFRRLLAMAKNGMVWEEGFRLLLENNAKAKENDRHTVSQLMWRAAMEAPIGFEIVDKEYYDEKLKEINTRIFDGFM